MRRMTRGKCLEKVGHQNRHLCGRSNRGKMVKISQEDESIQTGPRCDAGWEQYGQARKRLQILVLRELLKVINRVRKPGQLALVSKLYNAIQIVFLGSDQAGVFS